MSIRIDKNQRPKKNYVQNPDIEMSKVNECYVKMGKSTIKKITLGYTNMVDALANTDKGCFGGSGLVDYNFMPTANKLQ